MPRSGRRRSRRLDSWSSDDEPPRKARHIEMVSMSPSPNRSPAVSDQQTAIVSNPSDGLIWSASDDDDVLSDGINSVIHNDLRGPAIAHHVDSLCQQFSNLDLEQFTNERRYSSPEINAIRPVNVEYVVHFPVFIFWTFLYSHSLC